MSTWALLTAARTLLQEARGEPLSGQIAVAHVFKNRLASGRWGTSLAAVCLWRGQFSGWYVPSDPNFAYACNIADDDPLLLKMVSIVEAAMNADNDPTQGATHYYAPSIEPPPWINGATPCGKFGSQLFYKDVK